MMLGPHASEEVDCGGDVADAGVLGVFGHSLESSVDLVKTVELVL